MAKLNELERRLARLEAEQAQVDATPAIVADFADDDAQFIRIDDEVVERRPGESNDDVFARVVGEPRPGVHYVIANAHGN